MRDNLWTPSLSLLSPMSFQVRGRLWTPTLPPLSPMSFQKSVAAVLVLPRAVIAVVMAVVGRSVAVVVVGLELMGACVGFGGFV